MASLGRGKEAALLDRAYFVAYTKGCLDNIRLVLGGEQTSLYSDPRARARAGGAVSDVVKQFSRCGDFPFLGLGSGGSSIAGRPGC